MKNIWRKFLNSNRDKKITKNWIFISFPADITRVIALLDGKLIIDHSITKVKDFQIKKIRFFSEITIAPNNIVNNQTVIGTYLITFEISIVISNNPYENIETIMTI